MDANAGSSGMPWSFASPGAPCCCHSLQTRVQGLPYSSYCLAPAEEAAIVTGTAALRTATPGEGGIRQVYLGPAQSEAERHSPEGAIYHPLPVMPRRKGCATGEAA